MPSFNEVMAAYKATRPYVHETPVLSSNALCQRSRHEEVVLKCENLQRTGCYILRGGMNFVIRSKQMDLGINHFVTQSAGNLGLAVALAATSFSATGHVVIPEETNDTVVRSIAHYHGEIYRCGPSRSDQMRLVQKLVSEKNTGSRRTGGGLSSCVYVHPQDDLVVAGNGTVGVELMLQTDGRLDAVVVPAMGGALLAGVAVAVKGMKPNIAVYAAECDVVDPGAEFDYASVIAVNREENTNNNNNNNNEKEKKGEKECFGDVAHRIRTPLNADVAGYISRYVDGVIKVTDAQRRHAFRFTYERCKLVIDDDSATAVAAVIECPEELSRYKHIGIVLSGGNVNLDDIPRMARL